MKEESPAGFAPCMSGVIFGRRHFTLLRPRLDGMIAPFCLKNMLAVISIYLLAFCPAIAFVWFLFFWLAEFRFWYNTVRLHQHLHNFTPMAV